MTKDTINTYYYLLFIRIEHIKFGRVAGMSTRKGTAVLLEDILQEAKYKMLQKMKVSNSKSIKSLYLTHFTYL